jgi:Holliday junction resolvase
VEYNSLKKEKDIREEKFRILGVVHKKLEFFDPEVAEAPDVLPLLYESNNRYGMPLDPKTAKITDSERKVVESLNEKGYEIYRGGWPDFLAVNPKTRKAFFVEAKSNSDTLKVNQVHTHNLLLDFFHLHVTVVRAVAGYVPDFVDPEFDVEKYHAIQLDKCKREHREIINAIEVEKQSIYQAQEEYDKIFSENEKILKEMENKIQDQRIVFDRLTNISKRVKNVEERINDVEGILSDIDNTVNKAFQSVTWFTEEENRAVSLFDRYAKRITDDLNNKKKSLEDAFKKLKALQIQKELPK